MLSKKGRREAARLSERLEGVRVGAIYTSDLDRARETAAIVGRARSVPLHIDTALRERSFGDAEGHPLSELDPVASGIQSDRVVDADARPPAGESLRELYERVRVFISKLEEREPDGDVLVVTHGGVIRVAEAYGRGIEVDDMTWDPVPNTSVRGVRRALPSESVTP